MSAHKLALLNTTIVTSDGQYTCRTISLEDAKLLVKDFVLDSAIGHQSTADVMTELLGVQIPMNRQMFQQSAGQSALVFKLDGRAPEGKLLSREEIEEIGYGFKILTRVD